MIGVPGPRLSPELSPVIESTEFGRSLPRLVASATASRICCAHPDLVRAHGRLDLEGRHAGVLADGALAVGRLVDVLRDDRQRLRGPRAARARPSSRLRIAARTSGGRSVEVLTMSSSTLSKKAGSMPAV